MSDTVTHKHNPTTPSSTEEKVSILVHNVTVMQQGVQALTDISFQLQPREHLLITGASGSGKTTLAKALAGQLFVKGTITFNFPGDNHKVLLVDQRNEFKNLSNVTDFYYQQRFNSSDNEDALNVEETLLQTSNDKEAINNLLTEFGLLHRKNAPMIQLSSGEHKRMQLIKALLQQPQVLILDNPFTGLDINTRIQLRSIIDNIAAKGTQVIVIANVADAPSCITHALVLKEGKVDQFNAINKISVEALQQSNTHFHYPLPVKDQKKDFTHAFKMVNVNVKYGDKQILDNINWLVERGDCWLVKGHNGAGKSTLLSLITGDNPQAYANEIYLFDKRRGTGESIWDIKKQIGFASTELHWYFDKNTTCSQAIASGFFDTMGLYRQLSAEQEQILTEWIIFFELETIKNKQLSSLSAGHQRLILLARALVKNPSVLILDEPCHGLDEEQTKQFIQVIDKICTQTETTLIYVSHYDSEIPACVNKVLELHKGLHKVYDREIKSSTIQYLH